MERSLFFNAVETAPGIFDRVYLESDFADYFGAVLSSGLVHTDEAPELIPRVVAGTLNTVISMGQAIIKGHLYENTTDLALTHNVPEVTLDRIDRIVLRLDLRNQSRFIKAFVKEGVPGAEPLPPALQRDAFIYELSLAQVRVRANTVQLLPLDLIDERLNEDVCGLSSSMISIPTDQLIAEFKAWQQQFQDEQTASFQEWMTYLETVLDGNTAGNLLNKIEQNKSSIQDSYRIIRNKTILTSDWVNDTEISCTVLDSRISESHIINVYIHRSSLLHASYLLPVTESFNGGFKLFSNRLPLNDIVLDYTISLEVV